MSDSFLFSQLMKMKLGTLIELGYPLKVDKQTFVTVTFSVVAIEQNVIKRTIKPWNFLYV